LIVAAAADYAIRRCYVGYAATLRLLMLMPLSSRQAYDAVAKMIRCRQRVTLRWRQLFDMLMALMLRRCYASLILLFGLAMLPLRHMSAQCCAAAQAIYERYAADR